MLELFESDPQGDWSIEVESAVHDKADYVEYQAGQCLRVVQVKASMAGSDNALSATAQGGAVEILQSLATGLPGVGEVVVETNRDPAGNWSGFTKAGVRKGTTGPVQRVHFDLRDLDALERDVRARIAHARAVGQVPADDVAVERIALVLDGLVFRAGAADPASAAPGGARFDAARVRQVLMVKGHELAQLAGQITWAWGWRVPPLERIDRPGLLAQVEQRLPPDALLEDPTPSRVAITGFSGAGKSCLAGSWATRQQQTYAMVLWMPATTAELLTEAVRDLLTAAHGAQVSTWDAETVRTTLLEVLEDTPLPWLLVFDDAVDPSLVHQWTPSRGYGHIIITTRDAGWPPSSAPALEISALTDDELTDLVALRTNLSASEVAAQPAALADLARRTDRWPLAVEMLLAKMHRSGTDLAGLASLPHSATRRALAGNKHVPVGYPATVMDAVLDALVSVQVQAEDNSAGDSPTLAWQVLLTCAGIGGKAVPIPLIIGALTHTESPGSPPTLEQIDDAIADLRERSLLQRRTNYAPEGLPGTREDNSPWLDVVFLNDVITEVTLDLATEVEREIAEGAVAHLGDVLRTSLDSGHYRRALAMTALADIVIGKIVMASQEPDDAEREKHPVTRAVLAILGNAATVHNSLGDRRRALSLLHLEASLLISLDGNEALPPETRLRLAQLTVQTLVQLCELQLRLDLHKELAGTARLAVRGLLVLREHVHAEHWETPFYNLRNVLDIRIQDEPQLQDLIDSLDDLDPDGAIRERLGSAEHEAEAALRRGEAQAAEEVCTQALATETDPLRVVRLTGILAEATSCRDLQGACALIEEALRLAELHCVGLTDVAESALNLVVECHAQAQVAPLPQMRSQALAWSDLLVRIRAVVDATETTLGAGERVRYRIAVAMAAVLTCADDADDALQHLEELLFEVGALLRDGEARSAGIAVSWLQAVRLYLTNPCPLLVTMTHADPGARLLVLDPADFQTLMGLAAGINTYRIEQHAHFIIYTPVGLTGTPAEHSLWIDAWQGLAYQGGVILDGEFLAASAHGRGELAALGGGFGAITPLGFTCDNIFDAFAAIDHRYRTDTDPQQRGDDV